MSLRGFHIVFLILAAVSDIFVWYWTRVNQDSVRLNGWQWLETGSGWLAVLIIAYAIWFIAKKARTIIVG
jgi:hypothetical protein